MSKRIHAILLFAFALLIGGAALAHGQGHTLHTAEDAGWECELVPNLGWHCSQEPLLDQVRDGAEVITVRVYDEPSHAFTSTELLIRADLYHEQPCPQEDLEHYHNLGFGYYACHHR